MNQAHQNLDDNMISSEAYIDNLWKVAREKAVEKERNKQHMSRVPLAWYTTLSTTVVSLCAFSLYIELCRA